MNTLYICMPPVFSGYMPPFCHDVVRKKRSVTIVLEGLTNMSRCAKKTFCHRINLSLYMIHISKSICLSIYVPSLLYLSFHLFVHKNISIYLRLEIASSEYVFQQREALFLGCIFWREGQKEEGGGLRVFYMGYTA